VERWKLDNEGVIEQAANRGRDRKQGVDALDINGAKALKKRLERTGAPRAPAAARGRNVAADAPPVYRWTGVEKRATEASPPVMDDEPQAPNVSVFRRLGLSFR
jgi:hypothetical protein